MSSDAEPVENCAADTHRFVREHGHSLAPVTQAVESFANSKVERGVVKVMIAIVLQEEFKRLLHLRFGGLLAHRPANQHGGAVTHVGIYTLMIECGHSHVRTRR